MQAIYLDSLKSERFLRGLLLRLFSSSGVSALRGKNKINKTKNISYNITLKLRLRPHIHGYFWKRSFFNAFGPFFHMRFFQKNGEIIFTGRGLHFGSLWATSAFTCGRDIFYFFKWKWEISVYKTTHVRVDVALMNKKAFKISDFIKSFDFKFKCPFQQNHSTSLKK